MKKKDPSPLTLLLKNPQSLHSIPIKACLYRIISSSEAKAIYLNDCSLVPSIEERILGKEKPADQRRAAAQLNALRLCLYSVMMCLIKSWRDVEGG